MYLLYGIIFALTVAADQLTKIWAVKKLSDGSQIKIIGNFLRFSYVENRGAAFGIMQNQLLFFLVVTCLMLIIMGYIFFKMKNITNLTRLSLTLIGSGAVGNLIDRARQGFVIDFIDVRFGSLYDFPVFNIADSLVVCGTILLVILILFNKFERVN